MGAPAVPPAAAGGAPDPGMGGAAAANANAHGHGQEPAGGGVGGQGDNGRAYEVGAASAGAASAAAHGGEGDEAAAAGQVANDAAVPDQGPAGPIGGGVVGAHANDQWGVAAGVPGFGAPGAVPIGGAMGNAGGELSVGKSRAPSACASESGGCGLCRALWASKGALRVRLAEGGCHRVMCDGRRWACIPQQM